MNDDRFDTNLRSVVREVTRVGAPDGVRLRVAAATDQPVVVVHRFAWPLRIGAGVAMVAAVAILAFLVVRPLAVGPTPIISGDPRFAKCFGTQTDAIAAFPLEHARDYHAYFPNMGLSPELETDAAAFVVVFANPFGYPGPLLPGVRASGASPQVYEQPNPGPNHHDMCIWVGDLDTGTFTIYGDVDVTGMTASPRLPTPPARASATPDHSSQIDWEAATLDGKPFSLPTDASVIAGASFGGGYVLAGNQGSEPSLVTWWSADGVSWEQVDSGNPTFAGATAQFVVSVPGGLLMIGGGGLDAGCAGGVFGCNPVDIMRMWLSSDGQRWAELPGTTTALFDRVQLSSVAAGPSGLLAVGQRVPVQGSTTTPVVFTSPDGVTWREWPQFAGSFPAAVALRVIPVSGGYVVLGGDNHPNGESSGTAAAWFTSDGSTWRKVLTPNDSQISAGYSGADGVIALSATSPTDGHEQVWQSPDGQSWHQVTPASLPMVPMPSGPGLFSDGAVIVDIDSDGSGRPGAWWSTDGVTWTPLATTGAPKWSADAYPATIGPAGIVAVNYPTSYAGLEHPEVWFGAWTRPELSVPSASPLPTPLPSQPVASSAAGALTRPPVSTTATEAGFTLKMTLDHDRYRAGQPIAVTTTLAYGGPNDHVTIWGNGNPGPIGFDVVQVDGPLAMHGGGTSDCVSYAVTKGTSVGYAFSKLGGWSYDDPYAPYYASYYHDPQLRLPAGTWLISAKGLFAIGGSDCGQGQAANLQASIEIVVEP